MEGLKESEAVVERRGGYESEEEERYEGESEESNYSWSEEEESEGEVYEPTDIGTGLGVRAAKNRLEVFGLNLNPFMLNQDPSHSKWPILSLTAHTLSSGLLSMGIYVCLSIIGGHWWQVGGMAFLLGGFLILAWYHTLRWRSVMRHMKKMLQLRSKVLRDGMWSEIPSRELVPGDIIYLTPGRIVPARCVVRECSEDLIVDCRSVLTDKHILTDISGSSGRGIIQIGKDEELPAGSIIKSGEAYRVQILQTGPDTFLGNNQQSFSSSSSSSSSSSPSPSSSVFDDGLVSNLRRARRKDLVYMATRSLIILVFIVFIVAVGAALLTTILSDRQLAQVLATATFLIVFTAVHNPVGLILRYARTEGAKRIALRHGKRTGAALHSLPTVELLAAVNTLAIDVRGFLASEEVKVTEVFPMKHCTASGLLVAAALATTPESQAASSPLSPSHKTPIGDMEHVNMAILQELDTHLKRKLKYSSHHQHHDDDDDDDDDDDHDDHDGGNDGDEGNADNFLSGDSMINSSPHHQLHSKKKQQKKISSTTTPPEIDPPKPSNDDPSDPAKHPPKHSKKPVSERKSDSSPPSKGQIEEDKKDKKEAKAKKKDNNKYHDSENPSSTSQDPSPSSSKKPSSTPSKVPSSSDSPTSRTASPSSKTEKSSKSSSKVPKKGDTPYMQPTHAATDFLYESSSDEFDSDGEKSMEMRTFPRRRHTRPRTGSALRQSNKPSHILSASGLGVHLEEDECSGEVAKSSGLEKSSLDGSVQVYESDSESDDELVVDLKQEELVPVMPKRRRRRRRAREEIEEIVPASTLVHSSSSIRRSTGSPYQGGSAKSKVKLKGKDPCLDLESGDRSPMELSNYVRLGALFPPGCTVVHLQALSEEAIQYARESNPLFPAPQSSISSSLDTTSSSSHSKYQVNGVRGKEEEKIEALSGSVAASGGRGGLKMEMKIEKDDVARKEEEKEKEMKENPAFSSFLVAKGDPRSVIRLCVEREDEALVNKIDGLVKRQCEKGKTVVAVAKGLAHSLHILEHGPPNNLHLVGLLSFDGFIMPDTSKSLIDAFLMGLNIKMITNDSVASGSAFAKKLGLSSNVITIEDYLASDSFSSSQQQQQQSNTLPSSDSSSKSSSSCGYIDLEKTDGFAEVTPENRIHLALAAGETSEDALGSAAYHGTKGGDLSEVGVGGTGGSSGSSGSSGSPSSPSSSSSSTSSYDAKKSKKRAARPLWALTSTDPSVLYESDVGVTHRGEADVAVLSADVVLMQPGLRGLTRAIKEARKTLVVLEGLALACAVQSLRNIITLVAAWVTYGFQPIPTTSLTILVGLNLPMLLAVAHFDDGRVTRRPPSPFLIRRVAFTTFAVTLFEVIGAFLMGVLVYDVKFRNLTTEQASSAAFLWFGLANGFVVLLCRSPYGVVFLRPWPHPIILGIIFLSQVIATLLSVHGVGMSKIGIINALILWGFTLVTFAIQNIVFYASRLIWNRRLEKDLDSHSWFVMWHTHLSQSKWYRGLLTG
jgi:magnesium-transporting ATPase (P-type)